MNRTTKIISWAARIIAAVILLQTLFFKFTAHPDSVLLFTTLGMEPWGRIGTGIAELIVSGLLLMPRTAWLGALGSLGVVSGAIFFHMTKLGIVFNNDGGTLFTLAVIVFVASAVALYLHRNDIPLAALRRA